MLAESDAHDQFLSTIVRELIGFAAFWWVPSSTLEASPCFGSTNSQEEKSTPITRCECNIWDYFFYIVKWMKWKFLESQSPIHVILQFYSAPQASTISKTSFWIIHGYLLKVVVTKCPLKRKSFWTPLHISHCS